MPLKSKAKATHQGECQICDRVQKLPNNVLSQHGYKVEFGFFNGVCRVVNTNRMSYPVS